MDVYLPKDRSWRIKKVGLKGLVEITVAVGCEPY